MCDVGMAVYVVVVVVVVCGWCVGGSVVRVTICVVVGCRMGGCGVGMVL